MNYNEIKHKYPRAFEALVEAIRNDQHISNVILKEEGLAIFRYGVTPGHYFSDRDLFDFFDENMVWISIELISGTFVVKISTDIYQDMRIGRIKNGSLTPHYYTRAEAESAAFMKAFKVFEARLNQSKND